MAMNNTYSEFSLKGPAPKLFGNQIYDIELSVKGHLYLGEHFYQLLVCVNRTL